MQTLRSKYQTLKSLFDEIIFSDSDISEYFINNNQLSLKQITEFYERMTMNPDFESMRESFKTSFKQRGRRIAKQYEMGDSALNDWIDFWLKALKTAFEPTLNNVDLSQQLPKVIQEIMNDKLSSDIKNFKFSENNKQLNINFNENTTLSDLAQAIETCIDNNSKDNLIIKIWFRNPMTEDFRLEYRSISLANEEGFMKMARLLDNQKIFDLEPNPEERLIAISGDNGSPEWNILASDIIGLTIIDKRFLTVDGKVNSDNGGKFYKYKINTKYQNNKTLIETLKRYQIFENLKDNKSAFELNCLVYALKMSGLFTEADVEYMKTICFDRYVHVSNVDKLGQQMNIKFNIVRCRADVHKFADITSKHKIIGSNLPDAKVVNLALIDEHYILNEEITGISKYYLEHYDQITESCKDKTVEWQMKITKIKNGRYMIDNQKAHIKSYDFVQIMTSDKHEWSFEELKHMPTNLWNISKTDIKDLSKFTFRDFESFEDKPKKKNPKTENKEKKPIEHTYFYADTETDVSGDCHKAFCISYTQRGSNKIESIIGCTCLYEFLDRLPDNAVVYFHNLGYDAKMFSDFRIQQSIDKGSRTMSQNIKYKGKNVTFKDSLSILSMKLSRFPQTFGLKCGEKEMFPYRYYTFERLNNGLGLISEAGKDELQQNWNQQQFEENLDKLGLRVNENQFDMKGYVKFYCEQDVRILAAGFDKFRAMCLEALQIDIDEILTAPSLANKYFERELYKKIPNYFKYSGIVRAFIQKAIYGGRCMTRDNQKWKVENCELCDFDAVSLYPSAMARLYCQTGKCVTLEPKELDLEFLLKHTCAESEQPSVEKYISSYVVEIEVTKVGKRLHFPLIVVKNPKTGINSNTNEAENVRMVVDNITLEDFVKYQNVECKIIRGYKWTDAKDFKIRDIIQKLHNLRCEYKRSRNPLQEVIKLIMNSAYGKMIQKPIVDRTVYKEYMTTNKKGSTVYPLNKFLIKNSAKIKEIQQINENIFLCKVAKSIETFATNTLLGVQVLSMSKRIMNEVMTTAEDLDIKIFYQDTDSMHIEKAKLNDLALEFKQRFGRELIGKNLGQFHNDFDEVTDGYAYKSIFNGKKCYIDMLKNDRNEYGIHYRLKGVSLDCVKLQADGDLFGLYNELFEEKSINFDLLATAPRFKTSKDRKIINQAKFERCISFKGLKNYV